MCKQVPFLHYDNFFTPKFREMMWKAIEPNLKLIANQLQFNPKKFRVALHVRRGDVNVETKDRWLPVDYYTKLVKTIRKYADADIHLFSQGDAAPFKDLAALQVKLHLDTATDIAWAHMIEAQLFVMVSTASCQCRCSISLPLICPTLTILSVHRHRVHFRLCPRSTTKMALWFIQRHRRTTAARTCSLLGTGLPLMT
jgi:hypothetical protein